MDPDPQYTYFGVTIEPIDLVKSLNHFRHISQVKNIMTCRWSRSECFSHWFE